MSRRRSLSKKIAVRRKIGSCASLVEESWPRASCAWGSLSRKPYGWPTTSRATGEAWRGARASLRVAWYGPLAPRGASAREAHYADRLRYLVEHGGALIVLVGGSSGSGKSTIAAKVARRRGIEHVIGTDSVREALRVAIPPGVSPALHESSYTAYKTLADFVAADGKVERLGFLEHARPVASAVN